ncbi:MAG TPA: hypothetical protein DD640_06250 [Clostridiales bacterium]|nr:hypothetical protein [Clostridiales bacterium]
MELRKPKAGLLLIGAQRFTAIGEGSARGSYRQRKANEADWMAAEAGERFDVVFPGVIYGLEDINRAIDQYVFEKVDFVLAIYLSWSEDFTWARFLRDMPPVPILFAHRMRDSVTLGDTHDEDEFCEYLCCGGLVGALEASGDNARWQRSLFETQIGTWDEVLVRAVQFGNAARARALLRQSRAGLLASYNEVMWSTYVDPYLVFMKAGPELGFYSVAELEDCVGEISPELARQTANRLSAAYPLNPDVDEEKFLASVRATLGLELLAQKHRLDLLVLNDIDPILLTKIGLRPGFYPTNPDVSCVIVPEGDVGSGLAAYMLRLLTGKTVHYIEPFHIDLPSDTFEGGHAGPNDYTHPDGRTRIARDVRFAKTNYKYAGAPFMWHVFPQGVQTMVHVSQHGGGFILTAALVESLPTEMHLASYSHGRFRMIGQSCRDYFGKLLQTGVTQHFVLVEGDVMSEILQLGRLLDFETHDLGRG